MGVFADADNSLFASWKGLAITPPAFFLYPPLSDAEGEREVALIHSIDELIEVLASMQPEQPDGQLAVDILTATRGVQPVCELWSYESAQEPGLYYAYLGRDGRLEPCHREQPRGMTRLRRLYTLGTHADSDGELCAQAA
ncbi:hypothetical protein [Cupriavidus yeoncheonensis]|uniref:hypothetical protein n=1 Tax=Cupriavidus yeoncheonensis TaxID=1462994 RepID=UPI001BAA8DAF|nr:hypothetical protein [Cupriavidus yeoncheonensis]